MGKQTFNTGLVISALNDDLFLRLLERKFECRSPKFYENRETGGIVFRTTFIYKVEDLEMTFDNFEDYSEDEVIEELVRAVVVSLTEQQKKFMLEQATRQSDYLINKYLKEQVED